jgi:hypothetical protein
MSAYAVAGLRIAVPDPLVIRIQSDGNHACHGWQPYGSRSRPTIRGGG